jgi:serine/threonine-protein kinase
MRSSRPGAPRPARVAQYPADESPYGVRDMAGGLREWTSSIFDEGQHVIRGGTFGDEPVDCRAASRSGFRPELRFSYVGFRLAWSPRG